MSNSINLINKETTKSNRDDLVKKIRKISFLSLFAVGLISILLFLLSYRFSIGYVRTQEDKLIRKLSSFEQIGSKVFLLNSRLADISILLSSRKNYNRFTESIINQKPENLIISNYKIDSSGVVVEASSTNLSDINDFLNNLFILNQKKIISSVVINTLGANASGYRMQLSIN